MPKIETAGRYQGLVQSAEFGQSENTGTPFLNLYLVDEAGNGIGAWLYLSEKALPHTLKTLRDAFAFDGNFETAVEQITGKPCSFTCEMEDNGKGEDRLKVKWINAPRNAAPINDQASFLKSLTAKASRIPTKAAPAAAPTRVQPATRPTTAQRPAAATPATKKPDDDGEPF